VDCGRLRGTIGDGKTASIGHFSLGAVEPLSSTVNWRVSLEIDQKGR